MVNVTVKSILELGERPADRRLPSFLFESRQDVPLSRCCGVFTCFDLDGKPIISTAGSEDEYIRNPGGNSKNFCSVSFKRRSPPLVWDMNDEDVWILHRTILHALHLKMVFGTEIFVKGILSHSVRPAS